MDTLFHIPDPDAPQPTPRSLDERSDASLRHELLQLEHHHMGEGARAEMLRRILAGRYEDGS